MDNNSQLIKQSKKFRKKERVFERHNIKPTCIHKECYIDLCFSQTLFYFWWYWGVELRVWYLLGRNSTTCAPPLALFALVIFYVGSSIFPQDQPQTVILLYVPPM
jgi:hypothetical protein